MMNDFTKEELEDLRDAVFISGKPIELYDKIQSLIDNYCEHDFSILPAPHFLMMCSKCDKTYVGDDFPG